MIATSFALGSGSAHAVRLQYVIDAGIEDNDNVALSTTNPIDQRYFRAGLGFLLEEQTSSFQASITGRVDYRAFREDVLEDTVDGTLSGRFNWVAIPQRLHFTVEDSLSVQSINTLAPDAPSNRQQVNVLSAGPTLFFRSGETVRGQAELRLIDSRAESTRSFDSRRVGIALRAIKDLTATSEASFNVQGQRVKFDDGPANRDYDRYEAYGRYVRMLRTLELGVEGGYSRLDYRDGQTRSAPLVRGNATWRPTERSQVDFFAASLLSDSASDALSGLTREAAAVPEGILTGNDLVTASAYRLRQAALAYEYTGTLVGVRFGPYLERHDFIDPGELDQEIEGARLDASWRMRRTLTLDVFANRETIDFDTINRSDRTRTLGVALNKDWSRRLSTRLEFARYERSSSVPGQDIDQNRLYLSVIYNNSAR